MRRIRVIDSHTGGEPTRVIVAGGPDLGSGTAAERRAVMREKHDAYRSAVVMEPRGSDVLVGALLCDSTAADCTAGVIYFNNAGYLGMCGHATLGLVATLAHLGRIGVGSQRIETPVGVVQTTWLGGGSASLTNVPSYRKTKDVTVEVPGWGSISGDVAWGGNWFFLAHGISDHLDLSEVDRLTDLTWKIRQAVNANGFPEVDHIELVGAAQSGGDARGFVLCPGKAYDRSACGTGTSAKLACLAADGALPEGDPWVQESIIGSTFSGSYRWLDRARGVIEPTIRGTAFITAESELLLDEEDPFCWGIR